MKNHQGEKGDTGDTGADSTVAGPAGVAGAAGAEGAVGRTGQQGEAGPASMLDPDTAREIKRGLLWLKLATIMLYVFVIAVVGYTYWTAHKNSDALCKLRADVQQRIVQSQQFLLKNPDGIPGLPDEVIKSSIRNSQRTVAALNNLSCPAQP